MWIDEEIAFKGLALNQSEYKFKDEYCVRTWIRNATIFIIADSCNKFFHALCEKPNVT